MKSCATCPSYIKDPDIIKEVFYRPLDSPMCARFGFVLGSTVITPDDEQNLLQSYAEECEYHGDSAPVDSAGTITPVSINPRVAEPDQEILNGGPTGLVTASCHGCQNLVKADAVEKNFGWFGSICRAKGTIVFKPSSDSVNCTWATPGTPSDSVDGIRLRPQYMPGYRYVNIKAFDDLLNRGNVSVEPMTYETDAPVDPDDIADGIRAWRRVVSPYDGSKFVDLPIFRRDIFSEEEQSMIPQTGDDTHPELYIDYADLLWKFCVKGWSLDQTMLLQSEPGLGKTQFCDYLAWLMQVPYVRVDVGPGSEPDDLFGKVLATEGSTYWHDGRYTKAYRRHACVLGLNEPNMARDDVTVPLRSTTDDNKILTLDAGTAKLEQDLKVPRGKYTFQIWCINQAWDARNIGTRDLAAADMSRLMPTVVPYPPEAIERKIITERCKALDGFDLPQNLLDDMMKVSVDLRELSKNGVFPGTWGIREQIQVARLLAWFPFVEAYREAVLNFFEPDTVEMILNDSIKLINSDGA